METTKIILKVNDYLDSHIEIERIESKKFKHKVTGEIKTQISIMELKDYEPVEETTEK